ncbi:MAG TPA: hypothetical protein VMC86_00920 [Gemmatimonadales bacterium]|nr:hypothetical protein [Gemmatimonadales bacterium]
MSADTLASWLANRRPAPPRALAARIVDVVGDEAGSPPATLAGLGARLLDDVAGASQQTRRHALDLLAADALVTYAFEAQAEADVRGLTRLAERIGREGQAA